MTRPGFRRRRVKPHHQDEQADPAPRPFASTPPQPFNRGPEMSSSVMRRRQTPDFEAEQGDDDGNSVVVQQTNTWIVVSSSPPERIAHHRLAVADNLMRYLRDTVCYFLDAPEIVVITLAGGFCVLVIAFMIMCYLIGNTLLGGTSMSGASKA